MAKKIAPSRIVIEITERAEHGSVERLARRVLELKNLGYQIAVDDVGAGVSGLNRLMLLRPHWLKLDRELTTRLDEDRYKQNLIQFLVHFANLSGVRLIAEGVERREELATLIDSGIRHCQGYLLARPAKGFPTVDPEVAAWSRRRWAQAMMHGSSDPRGSELASLCQPAVCAQADDLAVSIAEVLLRDADASGVVVLNGRRFIGWCPRACVLEVARGSGSATPLGTFTHRGVATLPPKASIGEALSLVSVRTDDDLTAPVVIAHNNEVVGIVPLRALIAAAAQGGKPSIHGAMPLTGLPGRVAADRHLANLKARVPAGSRTPAHIDAAFVDIRQFDHINLAVGYDAGDRVIRAVGDALHAHAVQHAASLGLEAFVAHLGDDRFLVIAPTLVMEHALTGVADDFRVMLEASPLPAASMSRVGLRMLTVAGVLRRVSSARELHRAETQLRQRARAIEAVGDVGLVVTVADQRSMGRESEKAAA
jgi:predicted signal transduction protein with EAL and GGDEF domain